MNIDQSNYYNSYKENFYNLLIYKDKDSFCDIND